MIWLDNSVAEIIDAAKEEATPAPEPSVISDTKEEEGEVPSEPSVTESEEDNGIWKDLYMICSSLMIVINQLDH